MCFTVRSNELRTSSSVLCYLLNKCFKDTIDKWVHRHRECLHQCCRSLRNEDVMLKTTFECEPHGQYSPFVFNCIFIITLCILLILLALLGKRLVFVLVYFDSQSLCCKNCPDYSIIHVCIESISLYAKGAHTLLIA